MNTVFEFFTSDPIGLFFTGVIAFCLVLSLLNYLLVDLPAKRLLKKQIDFINSPEGKAHLKALREEQARKDAELDSIHNLMRHERIAVLKDIVSKL